MSRYFILLLFSFTLSAQIEKNGPVRIGADFLFEEPYFLNLKGKRIGLITNQSAINHSFQTTFDRLYQNQKEYKLKAVFAPEHGYFGSAYAGEDIEDQMLKDVPLYGLFGQRRRPTQEMLAQLDILVYDIQDIGSRSYTFISTLFYCMEEAARASIPMIVLDRPNPMGGHIVDGPIIEDRWRSFLGYVHIPYCHGMTVGELARFFNQEYKIGCELIVIPMKGWKREMVFNDTKLPWMPTSPQIPEADTSFFYPTTGLIGHCSIVNVGIGYTLPFKLIGAPWIDAEKLTATLNRQKLPGVFFKPFYYRPFFGKFKLENCQGVRILITNPHAFLPITTQFTIMGVLKNLYPKQFKSAIEMVMDNSNKKDVFNKLNGSEKILSILSTEKYVIWHLRDLCNQGRKNFLPIRKKYLNPDYQ